MKSKAPFTPVKESFHHTREGFYIEIKKDGPYLVYGIPTIIQEIIMPNEEGNSWYYRPGIRFCDLDDPVALCRCGGTEDAPFCDLSHMKTTKDLTERASKEGFLEGSRWIEGKECMLSDRKDACVYANFCGTDGLVWDLVKDASLDNLQTPFFQEIAKCPSGRLVAWNKETGEPVEPVFQPGVSILEDFKLKISGPIWVKGGIRVVSSDGQSYEVRNRVTLCRCGNSKNKPFCDGSHEEAKWCDNLRVDEDS